MQPTNYNSALFSGISFPPRRDGYAGFFATTTDVDLIKENVYVILNTRKGEMVMLPEFGSSVIDLLFENITQSSQAVIAQHIKEDLARWEPRLAVTSVAVYSKENTRTILIDGRVNLTGQQISLDFQFSS